MDFDDFDGFAQPSPGPAPAPPPVPQAEFRTNSAAPVPVRQAPIVSVPRPASPVATRAKAGVGVIAAAAGAGLGAVLGGPGGAAMGLVGVGAIRNLYRAQGIASSDPGEQADAARSVALCVVGFGITGYLAYRIFFAKDDD